MGFQKIPIVLGYFVEVEGADRVVCKAAVNYQPNNVLELAENP